MSDEHDTELRPPFCRQGNKYNLRDKILPIIPPHKIYVELFAGSGAIFFAKPKAELSVLNDLDKKVIRKFNLIKKAPTDPEKYPKIKSSLEAYKHFFDHHGDSVADRIVAERIASCNGYAGKPIEKSSMIYKTNFPNMLIKMMGEYQDKLEGVRLDTKDYAKIVKKYDSPETFFFIDPPYENTSKTFGYAQDQGFDFERLEQVLSTIKGNFLMTINDSPRIRKLFAKFHIKKVNVKNGWFNAHNNNQSRFRKELFITNYTI